MKRNLLAMAVLAALSGCYMDDKVLRVPVTACDQVYTGRTQDSTYMQCTGTAPSQVCYPVTTTQQEVRVACAYLEWR